MSDLLKEAIADAKAVRETALKNAKIALEEAFTPKIKSMLSAKLREEEPFEDEEEFGGEEEIPAEEPVAEIPAAEPELEVPGEEVPEDEVEENIIELNGQSFRLVPVMSEEEDEFGGEEELPAEEPFEDEEDELDLESVIKELEGEIEEGEEEVDEGAEVPGDGHEKNVEGDEKPEHVGGSIEGGGPLKEQEDEDEDEDEKVYEINLNELEDEDEEETVDEQSDSSDIGNGDNVVDVADGSDEEDPGKNEDKPLDGKPFDGVGPFKESYQSVVASLNEHKEAVKFLKDKLHEVNILNAKLLYTNKLFREFVLANDEKYRIVETFDRAQTVREIKLVYTTLAESYSKAPNVSKNKLKESASSKSGSTKPQKKIISEESNVADRFKFLAGLGKK